MGSVDGWRAAWRAWPLSVRATAALAAVVVVSGYALSFEALTEAARAIGIVGLLPLLYPVVVDGVVATAYVATFALRHARRRTRAYVWVVLLWAVALSVGGNALHAYLHRAELGVALLLAVPASAVPAVALALVIHVHVILARLAIVDAASAFHPSSSNHGERLPSRPFSGSKRRAIVARLSDQVDALADSRTRRAAVIRGVASETRTSPAYVRKLAAAVLRGNAQPNEVAA